MKRLIIIAACVLLLAGGGAYFLLRSKYDVVITQSQIDESLKKTFPITQKHLFIFEVTYSNPRATLLPESDRVEVGLDAELGVKLGGETKKFKGDATITTSIGYRPETGKFYLSDPVINKLTLPGVPQQYLDKATTAASEVAKLCLKEIPVFTLKAKDTTTTTARLLLRKVEVKSGGIYLTLGLDS